MVPRLLEIGLRGFQGFQYEDGMDYELILAELATEADQQPAQPEQRQASGFGNRGDRFPAVAGILRAGHIGIRIARPVG